jgi:hypothetical protein
MPNKPTDLDKTIIEGWRKLGLYYDQDKRINANQWIFYGSKAGLENFISLLDKYTSDPGNNAL